MHKRYLRLFLSPLHSATAVALYRESRRSRSRYRHSLDEQKLPLQSLQSEAHLPYGMRNMNPQKRGRCSAHDGEAGCNPETAGRLYTHYAAHELRRAQACSFFSILIFLMGCDKRSRLLLYNGVLQNRKPLISSVLRMLVWLENLMTGGILFQLT